MCAVLWIRFEVGTRYCLLGSRWNRIILHRTDSHLTGNRWRIKQMEPDFIVCLTGYVGPTDHSIDRPSAGTEKLQRESHKRRSRRVNADQAVVYR
jgi:hypothetical protein